MISDKITFFFFFFFKKEDEVAIYEKKSILDTLKYFHHYKNVLYIYKKKNHKHQHI